VEFGMRTKEEVLSLYTPLVHEELLGFHVHILRKEKQDVLCLDFGVSGF
jgi:hypothetical protein